MRKALQLVLLVALAAIGVTAAAQAQPAKTSGMYEIQITNFKVNPNKSVTVNVKIRGWKMYPKAVGSKKLAKDGGHWHIYVNGKYNTYSANATVGKTTPLKKGDYKLRAELANNDHSPLKEPAKSKTISVMVD